MPASSAAAYDQGIAAHSSMAVSSPGTSSSEPLIAGRADAGATAMCPASCSRSPGYSSRDSSTSRPPASIVSPGRKLLGRSAAVTGMPMPRRKVAMRPASGECGNGFVDGRVAADEHERLPDRPGLAEYRGQYSCHVLARDLAAGGHVLAHQHAACPGLVRQPPRPHDRKVEPALGQAQVGLGLRLEVGPHLLPAGGG